MRLLLNSVRRRCVILGAGAPHNGENPTLLESINGISVIDWLLSALALPSDEIDLVLGYQSQHILDSYPQIRTVINSNWQTTGSAASLLSIDLDNVDDLLVCYGDILIRSSLVDEIRRIDSPVVVAWDSHWRKRYLNRDIRDIEACEKVSVEKSQLARLGSDIPVDWATGEFIGLVRFSGPALNHLRQIKRNLPSGISQLHLSGLVERLRILGLAVSELDVVGDWAEVNKAQDIAHFVLGTKAETLERLRNMISLATIQEQISFTTGSWKVNREEILREARERFLSTTVVVRSSARSEDGFKNSNAGAYTSLLNVDVATCLERAIEEVIDSYQDTQPDDQVLIQPMVRNVSMSGVAFTRTLERGAPWYVINYEETGGTDGITSGSSSDHKTLYVRRDACMTQVEDERLVPLLKAIKEVERLLSYDALDIEFAISISGEVHILQVRPIAVSQTNVEELSANVLAQLESAEQRWLGLQNPAPHVKGTKPIFGVMPDWNPAEIIGITPTRLAESIYRYLILDETWATQRAEFGYRDVRPQPLLFSFAGKPYIDVRASFNSFIPENVSDELADKLVNFYLEWLERHPHLHDKVEFDVVPTCLGLNFNRWAKRLKLEAALSDGELEELKIGLRQVTSNAVERTRIDIVSLINLESRYESAIKETPSTPSAILERVRLLLDDCRRLGTLPFAHLARSGFVAITLLKEAVATGIISDQALEQFMTSVRTISHELSEDSYSAYKGDMSWNDFVEKYGHLRPGTYDLLSPAYRDDPERYLRPLLDVEKRPVQERKEIFAWESEKENFFVAVRTLGLNYSNETIEQFLRDAIEGREKAKFVFTKSLSKALDLIGEWGETQQISREDLSNIDLLTLIMLPDQPRSGDNIKKDLTEVSRQAKIQREVSFACELPALITKVEHFYSFLQQEGQPNYIGSTRVTSKCINLAETNSSSQPNVADCIVMIPQADPGYDWLFGQGISGLITMYGGANSHMAIRAAEFGLPAAIGVGEQLYRKLACCRSLELDPANARISEIQ